MFEPGDLVLATRVWSGKKGTVGIWKETKPMIAVVYDVIPEPDEEEFLYKVLIDGKKSAVAYNHSELEPVEDV